MEIHTNLQATGDELVGAIGFKVSEVKFFLAILKGIYNVTKAEFILKAIGDIEQHLQPKKLPMINYFHWCVKCGRDIDERDENTMRISKNDDVKYQCRVCKPLKNHRPQ